MSDPSELLGAVRDARNRLAHSGPAKRRSEGDFERVSIPRPDADALRDLLLTEKARTVIEIGLAYGSSALAIAEALVAQGDCRVSHLIIDAFQHTFDDAGWNALVAAGLDEVCSLLRERSQLALPRLVADRLAADAAFVDGSHRFHNVFVDLAFLWELVRPGGVVILDDCQWPSVATAARYFELNCGWRPQLVAGRRDFELTACRIHESSRALSISGPSGSTLQVDMGVLSSGA